MSNIKSDSMREDDMRASESSPSASSPLLGGRSKDVEARRLPGGSATATEGMSRTRIAVAVGFTWFGSFLAALGKTVPVSDIDGTERRSHFPRR